MSVITLNRKRGRDAHRVRFIASVLECVGARDGRPASITIPTDVVEAWATYLAAIWEATDERERAVIVGQLCDYAEDSEPDQAEDARVALAFLASEGVST